MWDVNTIRGMEIRNFTQRLLDIAARDTSADPENWTPDNPLWGHCAIASVLFQDFFEGTLKSGKLRPSGASHYWNVLPSGQEVDVTWNQFGNFLDLALTEITETKQREYVLSFPLTNKRYKLLKQRYQNS